MTSEVTINGNDLWSVFGGRLAKGSYEKLLSPAQMKDYISNESRLEHGKRIMVRNPRTESRDIQLQIFIEGKDENSYLSNYKLFINELQKGEISLGVKKLKTIYNFVYTGCSSYGDYGLKRGKFTVKFTEPDVTNRQTMQ